MENDYLEYLKNVKKYLSPNSEDIDTIFEITLCEDSIKNFEEALTKGGIGFQPDNIQLEKVNYSWIFISGYGHYHLIKDNNSLNAGIKLIKNK